MGMIAVFGASGQTGRPLVRALQARGARVRAIVRDAAKGAGADEVAIADLAEPDRVAAAVEGADAVHLIPPLFDDREEVFAGTVLEAVRRAGVTRFVYHSVLHAPTPGMPHHLRKARVEAMIRDSDTDWTIVQPAMYTTTPLVFLSPDRATLAPPFDLAEAVAAILTGPGHVGATYELTGPEVLTFREMAAVMAGVLGHPVATAVSERGPFLERRAAALGRTPRQTEELAAMLAHYDAHGLRGNANVLAWLLERPPIDFATALRRQFAL
jgi:NAD(P)H dehydrogenase (quinone)